MPEVETFFKIYFAILAIVTIFVIVSKNEKYINRLNIILVISVVALLLYKSIQFAREQMAIRYGAIDPAHVTQLMKAEKKKLPVICRGKLITNWKLLNTEVETPDSFMYKKAKVSTYVVVDLVTNKKYLTDECTFLKR